MSDQLREVPWYDRNPTPILEANLENNLAPHATTDRWSYEVPKGRIGLIESACCHVRRRTASTNDGLAGSGISLQIDPVVDRYILWAEILNKAEHTRNSIAIGHAIMFTEGHIIKGKTWSAAADGKTDHGVAAKITEFDAYPIEELPFRPELPKKDIQEPKKPWWWPF